MLTSFDDYFIHQTPHPVTTPSTSDRHAYDRYWFNGYKNDGSLFFGIGAARYPNLGVQDCGFSVVHDGVQHCFHASRRMPVDPADMSIGPFSIEVLEPLKSLRVVIDDNETGISADLTWIPRTTSFAEDHQLLTREMIGFHMEATRFNQFGHWEGTIHIGSESIAVDPNHVYGTKDRSWGVRPVGEPAPPGAPRDPTGFVFLWAPLHWGDYTTHVGLFENPKGHRWHWDGFIVPAYDDSTDIPKSEEESIERLLSVKHDLHFATGTRRVTRGQLSLERVDNEPLVIELEEILTFRMKGIGYGHPVWRHGRWHDELAIGTSSWRLDEIDEMALENLHVQGLMKVTSGDNEGIGVLEQIIVGPWAPGGFTQMLDPA